MPKLTLISGAKDFLLDVFAHRVRMTELRVSSFRFLPSSDLRAKPLKDGARFLSDWKNGDIGNFTEM